MKTRFSLKLVLAIALIISLGACEKDDDSKDEDQNPPVNLENGTVTDINDNDYITIKIGGQWWMAENLRVTHYSNGESIPLITDASEWSDLSNIDDKAAYCYYDNDASNAITSGALYTWSAAMNEATSSNSNPSGIQGVCPDDWHLPSDAEWTELENYLINHGYNYDGSTTGNKIAKSLASTSGWENLTANAGAIGKDQSSNNTSGFTAIPVGHRSSFNGLFHYAGSSTYWWSATEKENGLVWHRYLSYAGAGINRAYYAETNGLSVRCVKD